MPAKTILVAVVAGCLAVLLGLWPGVGNAIDELRAASSLLSRPRTARPRFSRGRGERLPGQIGFAAGGVALILFALFAYLID